MGERRDEHGDRGDEPDFGENARDTEEELGGSRD